MKAAPEGTDRGRSEAAFVPDPASRTRKAGRRKADDCMPSGTGPQGAALRSLASGPGPESPRRRRDNACHRLRRRAMMPLPSCSDADDLCPLPGRDPGRRPVLPRVRRACRRALSAVRRRRFSPASASAPAAAPTPRCRPGRPASPASPAAGPSRGRRAAPRHGHVLGPERLHGAQRVLRSGRGRGADGPGEGGCQRRHRAARRHGEPVRRRRDHGPVRHPGRPPRRRAPRRRGGARRCTRVVDAYLATLEPAFARSLAMHTGIATGLVVARRSDARAGDFALTGDTVNTAARLRSAAASREVVVSATTWQQVSDAFDAESTAPLALKGKDQALVAYRIRGARKAPAGDATALVGRDEELRDFRALAEACAQRRRSRVVDRARRPRRRQVAPRRRVRRDRARSRLLVPRRAGARLRRGDRARRGAQPRAQPARRRRRRRRGDATDGDRACERRPGRWPPSSSSSCTTCSTSRRRPSCARSPRR